MYLKNIILFVLLASINTLSFAQKKKNQKTPEISVDSLYAKDIQELKTLYPDLIVREKSEIGKITTDNTKIMRTVFVKYPPAARDNGIQGSVYSRFIVDTLGQVKEIKIVKGLGGGLSEEVKRVLNELGAEPLLPHIENGKKVVLYQKMENKFIIK